MSNYKKPPIYSWVVSSFSLFLFFFLLVTTIITIIAAINIAKKITAHIVSISNTNKTTPMIIKIVGLIDINIS